MCMCMFQNVWMVWSFQAEIMSGVVEKQTDFADCYYAAEFLHQHGWWVVALVRILGIYLEQAMFL